MISALHELDLEQWFEKYEALPVFDQILLQALSVYYNPANLQTIHKLLSLSAISAMGAGRYHRSNMEQSVRSLTQENFLQRHGHNYQCLLPTIEELTRLMTKD